MSSLLDVIVQSPALVLPWIILLLPLLGFTVLCLFGEAIKRDKEDNGAGILATSVVLAAFGLAVWVFVALLAQPPADREGLRFVQPYLGFEWIEVGSFHVSMSLLVDPLAAVMMLVVTGVGGLIHVYSLGYMAHDEERVSYFSYLNLFTFFMLLLILGGNLPLIFVGWEGVGLCSYLLIGFWHRKKSASDAGKKAFIVNRVGDAGLILGMAMAWNAFGTLDTFELAEHAKNLAYEPIAQAGVVTAFCLLLFLGACGKSAQLPLHVWLPDAMEGPTPVSALIHAATMVTAGVYMVARMAPMFRLSEGGMLAVAWVGGVTALMAATIALVQTDIKRVLAYSTVSQLGYMFLACGIGAFGVGVFHVFTHAFFKALLFLGSGSVIHAMSGEQDMRKMGGLRTKIPVTFWTFVVGTATIAGLPWLAGYYSKDEILLNAVVRERLPLFYLGLFTALLTAFYMSRLLFMTFFGTFRGGHDAEHHVHESPWTMLGPLVVLAAACFYVGRLHVNEFLAPALRSPDPAELPHPHWFPWVVIPVAVVGILGAFLIYVVYSGLSARIYAALRPLARVLEEKYGFDRAYDGFASRVVVEGSAGVLWKQVDAALIDGAVNGAGRVVDGVSRAARTLQTGFVRGYALVILGGAVALLGYLVWMR
ncbi:MAG TPA: NADH-quinone oxidoreductase subunit L [Vicinamibacteria bacterium]|nr:NADH-quinone oxidoreductase subunit L [Vicinamibacteria bacterium]